MSERCCDNLLLKTANVMAEQQLSSSKDAKKYNAFVIV